MTTIDANYFIINYETPKCGRLIAVILISTTISHPTNGINIFSTRPKLISPKGMNLLV